MKPLYPKGYQFTYGKLLYEKQDDNYFGVWTVLNIGKTTVKYVNKSGTMESTYTPASQVPHEERYSFKWTDIQVKDYFRLKD